MEPFHQALVVFPSLWVSHLFAMLIFETFLLFWVVHHVFATHVNVNIPICYNTVGIAFVFHEIAKVSDSI